MLSISEPSPVLFGRSICGDLAAAERREWLVTNGLGGFASGTVAGSLTRRYHGHLIAAFAPPLRRTLLVAKLEETALYADVRYELATNRWRGGVVAPAGHVLIERFALEGTVPVWQYALAEALLEKRIWMEHGSNTTYVRYAHVRGDEPMTLAVRALVNYRDFHATTHAGDWRMDVACLPRGIRVDASASAKAYHVVADRGDVELQAQWYREFELSGERERGLDDLDDHLCAAVFSARLRPGETVTFASSDESVETLDGDAALLRDRERTARLLAAYDAATPEARDAPAWMRRCVLAADAFVVSRPSRNDSAATSIVAGYHWFGEWGRDMAIALPGLTLCTGRADIAASALRTFASFVDGGMLPNYFPDGSGEPKYNTVDAALWYVEAVAAYVDATGDRTLLRDVYATLMQIVAAYRDGTRYGIRIDTSDGLPYAGAAGVQLTWMDAKVGDDVITPRIGKPVEIAALWYKALERCAALAVSLGEDDASLRRLAAATRAGFARFWNAERGYCFDVLDGPDGPDASLRPNQLFAVSLPHSPLDAERSRTLVAACARRLLIANALRSLAPDDARYRGHYGGAPRERDAAYHQGTGWLWLLGPFALAYARAYGDAAGARAYLAAHADALLDGGLGTLGEIVDGDPPFTPCGAIAQAWSVAEALRAWHEAPRFARLG